MDNQGSKVNGLKHMDGIAHFRNQIYQIWDET